MSESSLFVFTSSRSPNLHDTLGEPDEINVNIFFFAGPHTAPSMNAALGGCPYCP